MGAQGIGSDYEVPPTVAPQDVEALDALGLHGSTYPPAWPGARPGGSPAMLSEAPVPQELVGYWPPGVTPGTGTYA